MSPGLIVGLELALVLGGVLGLAVWELLRLRAERAREAAEQARAQGDSTSGPAPR